MHLVARALAVLPLLISCTGSIVSPSGSDAGLIVDGGSVIDAGSASDAGSEVDSVLHTWETHAEHVGGPERGFYRFVVLTEETDLRWVRDAGYRLVYSYVRLDAHRTGPIAAGLLTDLQRGLDAARDAGLKVVLRFAYNDGPWPDSEPDAPLDQVLAHIAQVKPLLEANADVLAVVQAGFIGAWGEWHTSTNGLLDNPSDRQTILEALLDALPPQLSTQIRYPLYKEQMYGAPRTAENAFDGSYASRTGHHNDCFVSSDTDVGTYPSNEVARLTAYVSDDTRWVPMGGETCAPYPARSDCAPAMTELARLHFSFLNEDYHPEVVQRWRDQGCYGEIANRLGYRLVLREGRFPEAVRPGGSFEVALRVENAGWAAPFNPRPFVVELRNGGSVHEATVSAIDVRRWLAGEIADVSFRLNLPGSIETGPWQLGIRLPDASPSLRARAEYALPFANSGIWDPDTGVVTLGQIRIDDAAPGSADPSRAGFEAR